MTDTASRRHFNRLLACLVLAAILQPLPSLAVPIFESAFGGETIREMLADGRYADVRDFAEERIRNNPGDGDMHAVLAYSLAALGDLEGAERSLLRAIELVVPEKRGDLRILHAEILLGLGDAAEAERQLRAVLETEPNNISALLEMGVLYRRTGDGVRSTDYFERVLRIEPGQETALRALFETYVARADYASIAKVSAAIPDDSPGKALGYYFDALALLRNDQPDYSAAADKLELAIALAGPSSEMLATLGWVRFRQQRLDDAAEALIRAVELTPNDFESQRLLGAVLLQGSRPNMAVGHLEQALAIRETVELRRLLARAYRSLGRNQEMAEQMLAIAGSSDRFGDQQASLTALYDYVGGDFEQSEQALRTALAEDPGASHLQFLLISSLLKQQRFEAAAREAQQAAVAFPDEQVIALNFFALARLGSKDYAEAQAALDTALAIDSEARTTRINLSTLYFRTGRYGSAEQQLERLLAANPSDSEARIRLARVMQGAGDFDRAERVLLGPRAEIPEARILLKELFLLSLRAGDAAAALDYANAIVAGSPGLFESHLLRSQALATLGRAMEAREAIDIGFRMTGETRGALAAAASLARVYGWHDQAVDYLRRREAQFGIEEPQLVKLYVIELIETGDTDKARDVLASGLGATDPDALFLTARSYIADGDQVRAERFIDAALAAGVSPAVIEQQRRGLVSALRLEELREDLERDDDDALRYRALAEAYEFSGDVDAAIAVYDSGLGKTPADEFFQLQIARLLMKKGDTDAAIDAANRLLGDSSTSEDTRFRAWTVIGMSREIRGETDRAERALKEATAPGSKVAAAHYRLATIKSDKGEMDEAVRLLRAAIELEPANVRNYLALAREYQRSGSMRESVSVYEQGLATIEDSVPLLNDLALTHLALGDTVNARTFATRALALAPDDAQVLDTMGQIHLQGRNPKSAIPYLERAVDSAPQSSLYRFHLGVSYLEAGSRDKARTELEESLAREADAPWAVEARRVLKAIGES